MRDGRTVKRDGSTARDAGFAAWHATLVVIEGGAAGEEHRMRTPRAVLGRGPAAEVLLEDEEISLEHAAIEFTGAGIRIVDLGSTNGTRVNGQPIRSRELEHGDRVQLGRHVLQLVLEKRDTPTPVYILGDD
jgi:pSer/pThr/pTyr-binding forkhead associated (FHA) protein